MVLVRPSTGEETSVLVNDEVSMISVEEASPSVEDRLSVLVDEELSMMSVVEVNPSVDDGVSAPLAVEEVGSEISVDEEEPPSASLVGEVGGESVVELVLKVVVVALSGM